MRKKKGISLIVLVITIIVMIVLAGAIILSLNNAGIIGKANQAVSDTDEANVKELAQMAWAEAYAEGVRIVETEGEIKGFKDRVIDVLETNNVDMSSYGMVVTTKGVKIVRGWIQDGLKVKRGQEELEIGQIVKYKSGVDEYTGEWKVLGADEEGNLLIMSAKDIKTSYQLGATTLTAAQQEWLSGAVTKLDHECEPYGKGAYALGARSIRIEDLDKVVGYIPEEEVYGKETIYEYRNNVTYRYNGTTKPTYIGTNDVTTEMTLDHTNGFYWYDNEEFHNVTAAELTDETNKGKEIVTIMSTYYGRGSKLSTDTEAYKMIFKTGNGFSDYWLASTYILTNSDCIGFGMRSVRGNGVNGYDLWNSEGGSNLVKKGIRAVVTLKSDIKLSNLI